MIASIRDTEIYFDIEGAGLVFDGERVVHKPVVFAIHGGPGGDHTGFKPAFSSLADKLQIVYFDHRGQGRSARGNPETYTLENNVEDMEALRQHLGLDQIVVLGVSYGGMVALSYAARYPQHVSHLIAVVTASDYRFIDRAKEIIAERGTSEQQELVARALRGGFEDEEDMRYFFDVMGPVYSLTYDPEKGKERRKRSIVSPEAANAAFGEGGFMHSYDVTGELHKITSPTLVIGARHDWICAPEFSELIAAKVPNSDLRIFEHSGHSVYSDEQQAFIDVVRGFVTYQTA